MLLLLLEAAAEAPDPRDAEGLGMEAMVRFVVVLLLFSFTIDAQTLNAYAKVSAISGAKTTLTVTNVNEASHTFTVGGQVVVMQMQDDVIGTNTTNIALATTGVVGKALIMAFDSITAKWYPSY